MSFVWLEIQVLTNLEVVKYKKKLGVVVHVKYFMQKHDSAKVFISIILGLGQNLEP